MSSRNLVIRTLVTVSLAVLLLAQIVAAASCQQAPSATTPTRPPEATGSTRPPEATTSSPSSAKGYLGNAMATSYGIIPVYPVKDNASPVIAFVSEGSPVKAVLSNGSEAWSKSIEGVMFGGFDFNQDGWPDLGFAQTVTSGKICGDSPMLNTAITLVDGRTGNEIYRTMPLEDKCWNFPEATYPTRQWTNLSVLFGINTATLAVLPDYATQGWFLSYNGSNGFNSNYFYYPSTASYDQYVNARGNGYDLGHSYIENSHIANGLIVKSQNDERLIFFTTGRVVQYKVGAYNTMQLLCDHPFLNGGRTDLAGRNKGLVAVDPNYPQHIVLLAGTDVNSVYKDVQDGEMKNDPWGHIERHVTIYNYQTDELQQRFFSSAHDPNRTDQNKYVGRTVYPANPFLKISPGTPSRIAYNVYDDNTGHWSLHISKPGNTADEYALADVFLWDIRDINADGTEEMIISPTKYETGRQGQKYYFPEWKTAIYRWNESSLHMDSVVTYDGIPYLRPAFREPTRSTISEGDLFPVLIVQQNNTLQMVLYTNSRQIQFVQTADLR